MEIDKVVFQLSTNPESEITDDDSISDFLDNDIGHVFKLDREDMCRIVKSLSEIYRFDVYMENLSFVPDCKLVDNLCKYYKKSVNENYKTIKKYIDRLNNRKLKPNSAFISSEKMKIPELKPKDGFIFVDINNSQKYDDYYLYLNGFISLCMNYINKKLYFVSISAYYP